MTKQFQNKQKTTSPIANTIRLVVFINSNFVSHIFIIIFHDYICKKFLKSITLWIGNLIILLIKLFVKVLRKLFLQDIVCFLSKLDNKAQHLQIFTCLFFGLIITQGGCYVATAVYGSYDCPQVWTLRRYRDYTLAGSWYGRAFIRTYYAISPILVKWFGHTEWFKKMCQGKLDRMVADLQAQGVESTPYEDKEW